MSQAPEIRGLQWQPHTFNMQVKTFSIAHSLHQNHKTPQTLQHNINESTILTTHVSFDIPHKFYNNRAP